MGVLGIFLRGGGGVYIDLDGVGDTREAWVGNVRELSEGLDDATVGCVDAYHTGAERERHGGSKWGLDVARGDQLMLGWRNPATLVKADNGSNSEVPAKVDILRTMDFCQPKTTGSSTKAPLGMGPPTWPRGAKGEIKTKGPTYLLVCRLCNP